MKKLALGAVALVLSHVAALAQILPNLPANTVWGRLGIGTGPGQPIPFATLAGNLNIALSGVISCNSAGSCVLVSATGLPLAGSGLTVSGTSGGVPYFNTTTSMVSSAALASRGVVVGGGAGGAPVTSGCTIDTNSSMTCSSISSSLPQFQLLNTTSDSTSASIDFFKSRTGGNTNSGDALGQLTAIGFANGGNQIAANITMAQAGSSSGSNIPSSIRLNTSNGSGQLNQTLTFDLNGHLGVAQTGTTSVSTCGSSPSVSGTDFNGQITTGSSSTTACTLAFAASFASAPHCTFTPVGAANSGLFVATEGTGSVIINYTSATSLKINYSCPGN